MFNVPSKRVASWRFLLKGSSVFCVNKHRCPHYMKCKHTLDLIRQDLALNDKSFVSIKLGGSKPSSQLKLAEWLDG